MRVGKYELLCELASGGMGAVHVARQTGAGGFSRLVVVKRLHRHLASSPEFRNMVRDEANLASQIRHPNVVPVLDVVEHEDELCLVFEYVPSVPLSALVAAAKETKQPLAPSVASRILCDVLAGLHAAHEVCDLAGRPLDIVHRDISPQNVIVGADGSARLIDFGIAKAAVRLARTKTGDLKGKLAYMSPEQLQRKEVDRRVDVFAAGALLYEVLTGESLFGGDDEGAVVLGILMGASTDLASRGFPSSVDVLLSRATAGSRDERFATARAFQSALQETLAPASTDDVASVVSRLCGASLEERRARVHALSIERTDDSGSEARTDFEAVAPSPSPHRETAMLSIVMVLAFAGLAMATLAYRAGLPSRNEVPHVLSAPASPARRTLPPSAPTPPEPSAESLPASPPSASVRKGAPRVVRAAEDPPLRKNPYR